MLQSSLWHLQVHDVVGAWGWWKLGGSLGLVPLATQARQSELNFKQLHPVLGRANDMGLWLLGRQVDPDKAFAIQIAHEESVLTTPTAYVQCALLYTSSNGERRIRWGALATVHSPPGPNVLVRSRGNKVSKAIRVLLQCSVQSLAVPALALSTGYESAFRHTALQSQWPYHRSFLQGKCCMAQTMLL